MLLSYLIGSHDRPKWLNQTIMSILKQGIEDSEILLFDNGSTNPEVFDVIKQYPQVNMIGRNDVNRVGLDPWSELASKAKGTYCILQSDDDILIKNSVRPKLDIITANPELSFIHSAVYLIDDQDRILGKSDFGQEPVDSLDSLHFEDLIVANHVALQSCIFKTDEVRKHWLKGPTGVLCDFQLYLNILDAGGKSAYSTIPSVYLRLHDGSDSTQSGMGMVIHLVRIWEYWLSRGWKPMESDKVRLAKSIEGLISHSM